MLIRLNDGYCEPHEVEPDIGHNSFALLKWAKYFLFVFIFINLFF